MALTFTGTNERRLTKQKKYSFLLENCSVNNLTGSADFGFKDSSNEIKFNFNQGNIFDFDDRNCFSYVKDEKFSISGDISDTHYTYKINDRIVAQGQTKTNFNIEKFFINTTSCTVSADNLKIYADSLNYSITAPVNVPKTTAFDVSVSLTSSDPNECLYIFGVTLANDSSSHFTLGAFTNEINDSTSGTIALTHTGTVATNQSLYLKLDTNVGEINKEFSINFHDANVTTVSNALSHVVTLDQTYLGEAYKEYIYQYTSTVTQIDNINYTTTTLNNPVHVSLEYVSGSIGAFYKVSGVNITNGGSGYTAPTVTFGSATSPDVTATGTATQTAGVVDSVTITNSGNYYAAVPTVTFGDPDAGAAGATGTANTTTYDKTFTNTFDIGTSFDRDAIFTDFKARGLTEAQGDVPYNSTYGDGKYKTTSTLDVSSTQTLFIKILALDHVDAHPISVKLKIEATYADSTSGSTTETENITIST